MHNTCGHTKRYTSKSMNETNNCVPDTVAHHVIFRACMWTPQSACHSNKSHHGTCTKIWRMAKPSFDHFQIKWSCPHYFGCSVFSPGWEVMHALGPNVCQELFQGGSGSGVWGWWNANRTIRDQTTSPGQTRGRGSMIQAHLRGSMGHKLWKEKKILFKEASPPTIS